MIGSVDIARSVTVDTSGTWYEIDPWGAVPTMASKLQGLGGSEPSPDPGYVFRTAFLATEAGCLRMRMTVEGCLQSDVAFLMEVLNRSDIAGSPAVRMRLALAPFAAIQEAGGNFYLSIELEPGCQYALAGFLHTDKDVDITALRIFADRQVVPIVDEDWPPIEPTIEGDATSSSAVRNVGRLKTSERPGFANPYSQPQTATQQFEPAFRVRCEDLGLSVTDPASWPEAFILQTLDKYDVLVSGHLGVGFNCTHQSLPWHLQTLGVDILMTRFDPPDVETDLGADLKALRCGASNVHTTADAIRFTTLQPTGLPKGYFGRFDFGWWIAPSDARPQDLAEHLNAIVAALKSGGIAIAIFPYDPFETAQTALKRNANGPMTRSDIERLAFDILGNGDSIAQLCFGTAEKTAAVSRFGLIIARG